jgi:hypothetical protein
VTNLQAGCGAMTIPMNTRLRYSYTDAAGGTVIAGLVLPGLLTEAQRAEILASVGEEGFVP